MSAIHSDCINHDRYGKHEALPDVLKWVNCCWLKYGNIKCKDKETAKALIKQSGKQFSYISQDADFYNNEWCLLMFGEYGGGKTSQIYAAIKIWLEKWYIKYYPTLGTSINTANVIFTTTPEMLDNIKCSMFDEPERAKDEYYYKQIGLLCVDDLGTEKMSEFVEQTLQDILDTRYIHKKPTIITTNLSDKELFKRYPRIASRFSEGIKLKVEGGYRNIKESK